MAGVMTLVVYAHVPSLLEVTVFSKHSCTSIIKYNKHHLIINSNYIPQHIQHAILYSYYHPY